MLVEIKQKSQVTIPAKLLRKMNLKTGDKLEIEEVDGRLVITPVAVIPRDQLWFYSSDWQQDERIAEQQIRDGKVIAAPNKAALLKGLGLNNA